LATKAFISAEAEEVFVAFFVLLPALEKGGWEDLKGESRCIYRMDFSATASTQPPSLFLPGPAPME
jgi:hypothetical protein